MVVFQFFVKTIIGNDRLNRKMPSRRSSVFDIHSPHLVISFAKRVPDQAVLMFRPEKKDLRYARHAIPKENVSSYYKKGSEGNRILQHQRLFRTTFDAYPSCPILLTRISCVCLRQTSDSLFLRLFPITSPIGFCVYEYVCMCVTLSACVCVCVCVLAFR